MIDERTFMEKATTSWGENMPEWIAELAEFCDRSSQAVIAKRLGVSSSLISTVIRDSYKGDMVGIELKVRAELLKEEIDCPVLGNVSRSRCLKEQAKSHRGTSPLRTELYHACRNDCLNSRIGTSK